MADELFVYGTLHPDRAPAEIASVVKKMRPLGRGTIRGQLLNLGDYPGVVLNKGARDTVPGSVFALPDDPSALSSLDDYEDFRPEDPANSLFVRAKRTVTLENGQRRRCWVYLYNGQLPKAG